MQENFQRQLRHITNTYFTASIVSHNEPQYWDQMTKKTSLKKKDVLQPLRASLYIVAIRDHNELEAMSQLLRAPRKYVASFSPAVCFSSSKKGGIWKVELISPMLFMTLFYTTTLSTCTRRVTQVRPEKGPRETALKIQGSTTMFLYALEMDIAITIEKQYESFEKLGLLFLYQGQKSSSKVPEVRYLHTYLTSYLPTHLF